MSVAKQAAIELVNGFTSLDRVAVVLLDEASKLAVPFTRCDAGGKDKAEAVLNSIVSGNSTNYCPALRQAVSLFSSETRSKKVVYFLTDGESFDEYNDPVGICDQARSSGIAIYAAAIGMDVKYRDLVMAISNNQFAPCDTPTALLDFFRGVDAQVSLAGVTNARLVLAPTSLAVVNRFHGVTRGEGTNYIKSDSSVVVLGDMAPGDEFGCYAQLQVTLPGDIDKDLKPPTNKQLVRKAFGFVRVVGDVPAAGLKDCVIKEEPIVMKFGLQQSQEPNEEVVTFVQVASSVYELAQGNVQGAARAAAAAEQTQAFSKDRIAQAMAAKVRAMGGMDAQQQKEAMQGATAAFDPARVAKARAAAAAARKKV